jgi:hypothetical protein
MKLTEITLLLDADWADIVDSDGGIESSRREFYAWDKFADGVRRTVPADISVTVRDLLPLSLDGILVVCTEPTAHTLVHAMSLDQARVWPHVFLLDVRRLSSEIERLDRLGAAGAILTSRYFAWRTDQDDDFGDGVIGLMAAAERIGARCTGPSFFTTARYCWMGAEDKFSGLPQLLAAYLLDYAELLP